MAIFREKDFTLLKGIFSKVRGRNVRRWWPAVLFSFMQAKDMSLEQSILS